MILKKKKEQIETKATWLFAIIYEITRRTIL